MKPVAVDYLEPALFRRMLAACLDNDAEPGLLPICRPSSECLVEWAAHAASLVSGGKTSSTGRPMASAMAARMRGVGRTPLMTMLTFDRFAPTVSAIDVTVIFRSTRAALISFGFMYTLVH